MTDNHRPNTLMKTTLASALFATTLSPMLSAEINLSNPGFEDARGRQPIEWSKVEPFPDVSMVWGCEIIDRGNAPEGAVVEGENALKIWSYAARLDVQSEIVDGIEGGQKYRISFHYFQDGKKGTEGHFFVVAAWYDADDSPISETVIAEETPKNEGGSTHSSGDFGSPNSLEGRVSMDVRAPDEATKVAILLRAGQWVKKDKPYYLDDFRIEKIDD